MLESRRSQNFAKELPAEERKDLRGNGKVRKYESEYPNLEDWTVIELFNNVHDVGFLGRWRWLDQKLNDYDVDHEELSKLSD
uniref:DUF4268 domain-containing protein n=1 Tax=Haemonchus contortus TaxID=6289 RepID=A0A7I4Z1Q7_HAECO